MFTKKRILNGVLILTAIIVLFLIIFQIVRKQIQEENSKTIISKSEFQQGDSIYKILRQEGLNEKEIVFLTRKLEEYVPISKIRSGQEYAIERSSAGVFDAFYYCVSPTERYKIYQSSVPLKYNVEIIKDELKFENILFETEIQTSLYNAVVGREDGNAMLAVEVADIYSWQIDFFTDPRPGDKLKVLYERVYTDSGYSKMNRILAAQYITKRDKIEAFYYLLDGKKDGDYYDRDGNALRKAFLKAPLNYRRISSYFALSRMHPILRYRRPHLGIDYAAPTGTPVVSVGDGTVIFVGYNGGYGKQVKVRHNSTFETWYAHLHSYAKGIKTGVRVKQGQVIGSVGATGMATGPHLDFRVKKNNSFVDYLNLKFPSVSSISKDNMDSFRAKLNEYLTKIEPELVYVAVEGKNE